MTMTAERCHELLAQTYAARHEARQRNLPAWVEAYDRRYASLQRTLERLEPKQELPKEQA